MKIPKYVDKILVHRRNVAKAFMNYDNALTTWMESQGIDCTNEEIIDCLRTGAISICEPSTAERVIRDYIKKYEKSEWLK